MFDYKTSNLSWSQFIGKSIFLAELLTGSRVGGKDGLVHCVYLGRLV